MLNDAAARVRSSALSAGLIWIVAVAGCGRAEAIHGLNAMTSLPDASISVGAGGQGGAGNDTGGAGGSGGAAGAGGMITQVTPSCTDHVKNGGETDVDCGGNTGCPVCKVGQMCLTGSDCENGVCIIGFCQFAGCYDQQRNGTETDIDC